MRNVKWEVKDSIWSSVRISVWISVMNSVWISTIPLIKEPINDVLKGLFR